MKISKIKVCIIGENRDNDAKPLQILLKNIVRPEIELSLYPKNFEGGQLEGAKFFRLLSVEADSFDYIIVMRDLDALITETDKIRERTEWFEKVNKQTDKKGIFFLVIYELEALILSDIAAVNSYFGLKLKALKNPLYQERPKEKLERDTLKSRKGKYRESDAPKLFEIINWQVVYQNHQGKYSFQQFINELAQKKLIDTIHLNIAK